MEERVAIKIFGFISFVKKSVLLATTELKY